jgi:hypothetical protein
MPGMIQYWRGQGYSPAQIDQLIEANGGTLPPKASVPSLDQTRQDQLDAIKYYQKLTGGTSHPELGTIDGFREYAQGRLGQFAEMSGFTGGSELNMITSPIFDSPNGGPVGSGRLTTSNPANDVFYEPSNSRYVTAMPPIGEQQFKWIDDFAKSHGIQPQVWPTPGKAVNVSNPNADVFSGTQQPRSPAQDYSQSTRMDNSGMLDGMIQGQMLGAPLTQPYGGWAYPVQPMPAAPAPANAGLLNAILTQYYGGAR